MKYAKEKKPEEMITLSEIISVLRTLNDQENTCEAPDDTSNKKVMRVPSYEEACYSYLVLIHSMLKSIRKSCDESEVFDEHFKRILDLEIQGMDILMNNLEAAFKKTQEQRNVCF